MLNSTSLINGFYAGLGSGIAVIILGSCPESYMQHNSVKAIIGGVGTYVSLRYLASK